MTIEEINRNLKLLHALKSKEAFEKLTTKEKLEALRIASIQK